MALGQRGEGETGQNNKRSNFGGQIVADLVDKLIRRVHIHQRMRLVARLPNHPIANCKVFDCAARFDNPPHPAVARNKWETRPSASRIVQPLMDTGINRQLSATAHSAGFCLD